MSDSELAGFVAGLAVSRMYEESADREKTVTAYDEAKLTRERAMTAAKIAFDRDLANSKTSQDCDDALTLCKARMDEAQAQYFRAVRRSE